MTTERWSRDLECDVRCVCGLVWCEHLHWECPGCGVEPAGDVA